EAAGVVQQRLVEQREVRGAHDGTTTGYADRAIARVSEPFDVDGGRVADLRERRHVSLLIFGDTQQAREAERRSDALLDEVAKVDAAQPLDEVRQHPLRRGGVVLEAGARLPLEFPSCELLPAARRVGA